MILTNGNDDEDDENDENYEDDEEDDNNNFNFANILCKQSPSTVPQQLVLLDNQSTIDVFQNTDLFLNIRDTGKHMRIHCNAGITTRTLMRDIPGYGKVWFHTQGKSNIISLARLKEKYRINGNKFVVLKKYGSKRTVKKRILYFSVSDDSIEKIKIKNR